MKEIVTRRARQVKTEKVYKRLTIDQLRKYPGLENLEDEEAGHFINSLEQLSILMFQQFKRIKLKPK